MDYYRISDDELTQLLADQGVLLLAIRRGFLTADDAARLQLELGDESYKGYSASLIDEEN